MKKKEKKKYRKERTGKMDKGKKQKVRIKKEERYMETRLRKMLKEKDGVS